MGKREFILMAVMLVFVLSFLSAVSAGVYFSQPEGVYNLGDIIETNIEINPLETGPLKIDLICGGNPVLASYGNPSSNQNIQLPLNSLFLKDIKGGDCYFSADYNNQNYESRGFKISNSLNIQLDINNIIAKPGDNITVSGTAKRLNNIGINGNVEIIVPLLNLMTAVDESEVIEETETNETEEIENNQTTNETQETEEEIEENQGPDMAEIIEKADTGEFYGSVSEGVFSMTFSLPEDIPAGNYRIDVHVFEKLGEEITSEGLEMADLQILQVLKGIDIAVDSQSIDPGNIFNFKPILLDQTGASIQDEVSIIITNEKKERIYEKIYQSDETAGYNIPTNLKSGYYDLKISNGEFEALKKFYVNEKRLVSFDLINDTLVVTNIGNIPYDKDFEIELNGKPFVRKLDLNLNESQKFKLTGDGDYNIRVSDGENEIVRSGVALTGHAVNVKAIREGSIFLSSPIVWIFFIIVLGAGILFLFRNILKKKSFAYPFKGKLKEKFRKGFHLKKKSDAVGSSFNSLEKISEKESKEPIAPRSLIAPKEAEQVLVLSGQKNNVSVVGLKIKNKLSKDSKNGLKAIIEKIQQKGVIYESKDYIFIIFTPLMTRSFKNEVQATKIAELLQILLKKYNRKFKDKIEFGIAVGSGEMVNKIEKNNLKFTPLGNFMGLIKKLADSSEEKVLITKEAYDKSGEIKGTKLNVQGSDVYELRRVVDYEANQKFIHEFLERMGKEGKKE